MSLRGLLARLVTMLLTFWIVGSFTSFWLGLYLAVVPVIFYEVLRPR